MTILGAKLCQLKEVYITLNVTINPKTFDRGGIANRLSTIKEEEEKVSNLVSRVPSLA